MKTNFGNFSTSGFGQSKQTPSFGSSGNLGVGTATFGQTNFNQSGNMQNFSQSGNMQNLSSLGQGQRRQEMWAGAQKFREIRLAYAPLLDQRGDPIPEGRGIPPIQNDYCEFYRWTYNTRDPRIVNNASGPTLLGQRRLWEEVERDNPDPEHLITTQEIGIGSLKRRFDQQKIQANRLKEYCDDILSTLVVIRHSSHLSSEKISELEAKQARLYHKLLVVVRKLELFRLHRRPLTPDEQRYRERLDRIVRALRIPSATIQELITVQTQMEKCLNETYGEVPNQSDEEKLCAVMEKQREGLQHLTNIIRKDMRDLDILKNELTRNHDSNYFES